MFGSQNWYFSTQRDAELPPKTSAYHRYNIENMLVAYLIGCHFPLDKDTLPET